MNATIEEQISSYVADRLDALPPVTVDEVLRPPSGRRVDGRAPSRRLVLLRMVAAFLVVGAVVSVVALRSRTSHHGTSPRPSAAATTTTALAPGDGRVCGEVAAELVSVVPPMTCPTRTATGEEVTLRDTVTIRSATTDYLVRIVGDQWSAVLPAGTYTAVGPGCTGQGTSFQVVAGETTVGVVVEIDCNKHP